MVEVFTNFPFPICFYILKSAVTAILFTSHIQGKGPLQTVLIRWKLIVYMYTVEYNLFYILFNVIHIEREKNLQDTQRVMFTSMSALQLLKTSQRDPFMSSIYILVFIIILEALPTTRLSRSPQCVHPFMALLIWLDKFDNQNHSN